MSAKPSNTTSLTLIAKARSGLVQQATEAGRRGDHSAKADAEMRVRLLNRLSGELREPLRTASTDLTVFIAYSNSSGKRYYEVAKRIAEEQGFQVIDGFTRNMEESVLKGVLSSIGVASLFLGILTPEYKIGPLEANSSGQDPSQTAPSVWVIEEKGMALALAKPTKLLIQETVHDDFWRRTTPDKLHIKFTEDTFEQKAVEAIDSLHSRFIELMYSSQV